MNGKWIDMYLKRLRFKMEEGNQMLQSKLNESLMWLILVVTHSLVRAGSAEKEFAFTDDSLFQDKSLKRKRDDSNNNILLTLLSHV